MEAREVKDVFESHAKSLGALFAHDTGLYIPAYQRPYRWSKDDVERLVNDIAHGLARSVKATVSLGNNGERQSPFGGLTFVGTLIFIKDKKRLGLSPKFKQEMPPKVLLVIDGQQRLSTLQMIAIALHDLISRQLTLIGNQKDEHLAKHIKRQGLVWQERLQLAFAIEPSPNVGLHPRTITGFQDLWAYDVKDVRYQSPLAHFTYRYLLHVQAGKKESAKKDFSYKEALKLDDFHVSGKFKREPVHDGMAKRYEAIAAALARAVGRSSKSNKNPQEVDEQESAADEREVTVDVNLLLASEWFLQSCLNLSHESEELVLWGEKLASEPSTSAHAVMLRLLGLSGYFCERVAVTSVEASNEESAFEMFESLNTTGVLLTSYETFRPLVMKGRLDNFQGTAAARALDSVDTYLKGFSTKPDDLKKATDRLLISFGLLHDGKKLGKSLAEQRFWLRQSYFTAVPSREQDTEAQEPELRYLNDLAATAEFLRLVWLPDEMLAPGLSSKKPEHLAALTFLRCNKVELAIPILTVFFKAWQQCDDGSEKAKKVAEFWTVVLAVFSFFVLWRVASASRVDDILRGLMQCQLCATLKSPEVTAQSVVSFFRSALAGAPPAATYCDSGGLPKISSFSDWFTRVERADVYQQPNLAKALLLVAHCGASPDDLGYGGIKKGATIPGSALFTAERVKDWTIEHIVPQKVDSATWGCSDNLNPLVRNYLGNLTVLPRETNTKISNAGWPAKHLAFGLMSGLVAKDATFPGKVADQGAGLNQSLYEELGKDHIWPHVAPLAKIDPKKKWSEQLIVDRGRSIACRAYEELMQWLPEHVGK
jgi:hypothetical protein